MPDNPNGAELMRQRCAYASRDMSVRYEDAFTYAIVLGWGDGPDDPDDAWADVAELQGWDDELVAFLRIAHARFKELGQRYIPSAPRMYAAIDPRKNLAGNALDWANWFIGVAEYWKGIAEQRSRYQSLPPGYVWQDYYSPDEVARLRIEEERRRGALQDAVRRLDRAITNEGIAPGYHRGQAARLIREWPTLWDAITAVREAGR
jgi:hypothetical protein